MAKKFKPKYAGHGVQIDGPPVDSAKGQGLQEVSSSDEACCGVQSQSDKDMVDHSLLNGLGDDFLTSDAMCDVDDDGVEHEPQGVKEPGHAKAADGYTSKVSHNHENSIAESSFMEQVAEMMDGGAVAAKESSDETVEEEGELTMEELFESYLEEAGDEMSYEGFAGHCADAGYEQPELDATQGMMADHEGYVFTPVGNGLYKKEAVPQTVEMGDLPGMQESSCGTTREGLGAVGKVAGAVGGAAADMMGGDDKGPLEEGDFDKTGPEDVSDDGMEGGDKPPVNEEGDNNHHPEADDFNGKEKRVEHHSGKSVGSDIKQGAPQPAVDYSDGHGMEVKKASGGAVTEDSVTTAQVAAPPSTKPEIKKQKLKKAGDASKAVKDMKNHGEVMDRKYENDDNVAESFKVPGEIAGNVNRIMEHVNKQLAKFPNGRKYSPQFRTVVELNGKQGRTQTSEILAEAAVDAEELAVIGKGNVALEVMLFEGEEQKGMFIVELPKLEDRKPAMVAEGVLFRFPSIAKRVSETMIGESVTHSVGQHAFGAIIKGNVEELAAKF